MKNFGEKSRMFPHEHIHGKTHGRIAIGTFIFGVIAGGALHWFLLVYEIFPVPLTDSERRASDALVAVVEEETEEVLVEKVFEEVPEAPLPQKEEEEAPQVKKVAPVQGAKSVPFALSSQHAGSIVLLDSISLSSAGWVAVYEIKESGALGSILGARRFDAGEFPNEPIELLRSTIVGNSYLVVLHGDDGDQSFDFARELPLYDGDALVSVRFSVTL